jgi:hypothetical protein
MPPGHDCSTFLCSLSPFCHEKYNSGKEGGGGGEEEEEEEKRNNL